MLFAEMGNAEMFGAAIGTVAVCFTLLGCTWKISGRMSGMETALRINTDKVEEVWATITDHTKECDTDRAGLGIKVMAHEKRLDSHSLQLDNIIEGKGCG